MLYSARIRFQKFYDVVSAWQAFNTNISQKTSDAFKRKFAGDKCEHRLQLTFSNITFTLIQMFCICPSSELLMLI